MIHFENHMGKVEITETYFANLIGNAVSSCFGVVGMAHKNTRQQLRAFLKKGQIFPDQGVGVEMRSDGLFIELHIIITYGLNISAICQSITHKVKYTVEQATGLKVGKIKVFVDGMKAES
ncbi:MAG: Asp23/Gls24 family envelope stress response protein [Clostridia bacterium]|nr:Asp23/Gls24 family envelope stress response protein [Clostridia bacterium]